VLGEHQQGLPPGRADGTSAWSTGPRPHGPHPNKPTCVALEPAGEPPRRAKQMYQWMYGSGKWARSLDEADGSPQSFSAAFKTKVCGSLVYLNRRVN
jgi:hypothetical protein